MKKGYKENIKYVKKMTYEHVYYCVGICKCNFYGFGFPSSIRSLVTVPNPGFNNAIF